MDLKEIIANKISKVINIDVSELKCFIEVPKDSNNGDYSFPCFRLAKELRKSPIDIATMIKDSLDVDDMFEKVDVILGYLNFYVNKSVVVSILVDKFKSGDKFGSLNLGRNKRVIIEYSSPNIAKPFHIGHLKNTVIGHALDNLYRFEGYNVVSWNHLGDYGTQFAKLIEAYKRWGNEYDLNENPIKKLVEMYVRINQLCAEDESVLEESRETFKKLEDGNPEYVKLRDEFTKYSMIDFNKIYDLLGIKFDKIIGESFYIDKIPEMYEVLEKTGRMIESENAMIVDLTPEGIDTPCIVKKSNGASIYAARDLASILYRVKNFDFDKCLYVIGNEQAFYFKQIFAIAKIMGIDKKYIDGLEFVGYGMLRLPEGKMSTRKGNFVEVEGLLEDAINRVKDVIIEKDNVDGIDIDDVSKKVGIGAVVFSNLLENRVKDSVFDVNTAISFQGDTGPYVQYMAVRTKSILAKVNNVIDENIDVNIITDDVSINLVKVLSNFENVLKDAIEKNEPSFISRYLLDLAKTFSSFYNTNKIICDEIDVQKARIYLTYITNYVLVKGLNILGIEVPDKM